MATLDTYQHSEATEILLRLINLPSCSAKSGRSLPRTVNGVGFGGEKIDMPKATSDSIIEFLKGKPLIKINQLEEITGMPQRTLQKAVTGKRGISDKHLPALIKELKKYGYK